MMMSRERPSWPKPQPLFSNSISEKVNSVCRNVLSVIGCRFSCHAQSEEGGPKY